jgi:hypothetical protein
MSNNTSWTTFGELGLHEVFCYKAPPWYSLCIKISEIISPRARTDLRTLATYNAVEVSPFPGTFHNLSQSANVKVYPDAHLGLDDSWIRILKLYNRTKEMTMKEWTLTLDTYPDDHEEVLGCRRDGLMDVIYHDSKTHAWYMDWIDGDTYCTDEDYDQSNGVIAWQPLPKPPYQEERRQHGTRMDFNE